MESLERRQVSPQPLGDECVHQSTGQTPTNQPGNQSRSQGGTEPSRDSWGHALNPEFQGSNLSPAFPLMPLNSGVEHNFTEFSSFQQSDLEFAPLRAYPDISMASERSHFPPQDGTTQVSEQYSLSQHPLAQTTILSEEAGSSCCSLSQHSLSPGDNSRGKEASISPPTDTQGVSSSDLSGSRKNDSVKLKYPPDKGLRETSEDETYFLSKDIPAHHLLDILQKDFGMPSSSSSAVSSASETSVKNAPSFAEEAKSNNVCKPGINQSKIRREGPTGEVCQRQPARDLYSAKSRTLSSEVSNITMGLRSTRPDDSSELLHRELLSEVERRCSRETETKNRQMISPTQPAQPFTPYPQESSEGKQGVTRPNVGSVSWTGPFSAGLLRGHKDQDLWSSGNQTGIDGSYLGFLPQSQSTPGVFKAPPKSSVKIKLGQLSDIESSKENSHQSGTGISPQRGVPISDVQNPDSLNQRQEEAAEVQSLPSVNFMEKVDAWRANQSSGKMSLFDSLALQGFSGASPKKKAYDAVSDTLSCILNQQAGSLQQPPIPSAASQNIAQSSHMASSGSFSLRRGEAVGSAPGDKDNSVFATRPSASPVGRSQSHSSISTVVVPVQKDQQTETPTAKDSVESHDDVHHQPSATVQTSPFMSLGHFSDVSLDQDLTQSSSQDSYNSGVKVGTSIGASSVVSLEVDNYVPNWTSKLSTPPPQLRPRELNIEERIPLYLHNLGIDQSPSTILTPFAPRGPIREPEFSPTDLCTIKGSIGTPSKSTQPSEGGSPHKGEFSKSSVLSVDSSVSISFSLDSLGPALSVSERPRRASPLSDIEAVHSEQGLAVSSEPEEDSYPSTVQTTLQQQKESSLNSSQSTLQPEDRFDSNLSLATRARCVEPDFESPLQTSRSLEQSADSFVSSKALMEIRKLLSQAENVVSAGSSTASSASPAAPRLLSDNDIFLSLRKTTSRPLDSSFSFSAVGDPRTRSSLLGGRSSSDSMLISEKARESSVGQEGTMSLGWQNYKSTQAPATGAQRRPQDNIVGRDAGSSFVLSQSARRAEPEGCSAAPPDNAVPTQQPLIQPLPAPSSQQLLSTPADTASVTEEEIQTAPESPVQSSSSSPVSEDQGVMSDGSSESSLAVRVAKLLQNESPATMASSSPSVTDQEESKAREWIKLKISGQQCEPLELDKEDRRRIEEIKTELLLKNPIKSHSSTDTESSAASSVRLPKGQDQLVEKFPILDDTKTQSSQPQQDLKPDLSDSSLPPANLEAQVREIAAREGVNLPKTNPLSLTSITIATRKRSTSPSPSTSPAPPVSPAPEPLHLTELTTDAVKKPRAVRLLTPSMEGEDVTARHQNLVSQSALGIVKRQETVGGQCEEPSLSSQGVIHQGVDAKVSNSHAFRQDEEISLQENSVSGVGLEAEPATNSATSESPARPGHVSRVRLTLSPKINDYSATTAAQSSHTDASTLLPHKEFVPLRHSSSATSSPDEGVGLSSPPEWFDNREIVGQRGRERAETSALFKPVVPQGKMSSTSTQAFTPRVRGVISPRPLTNETPVPVLLPYKPRGSEELFYIPQANADVSTTDRSDTTMESSHTGSDDAVPPRFSSDVLGHLDPGLDRGVTIRHTEGIYSKRFKTTTFKMQEPEQRGGSVSVDSTSQTAASPHPKPSSQVSVAFTQVCSSSNQVISKRDQGTSPVQFLSYAHPESSCGRFRPVHMDSDHRDKAKIRADESSVQQAGRSRDQERRDSDLPHPSSLDQLWQQFCDRWSQEEYRPNRDREVSLLERLERLSHLIHSSRGREIYEASSSLGEKPKLRGGDVVDKERKRNTDLVKRRVKRGGSELEHEPAVPSQAWTQRRQVGERSHPADQENRDSFTSSFSHDSSVGPHAPPADRDETESVSSTSGSLSTVDTARLIRAYGAHRVKHLKASSSLSKLYSAINRQKEGKEEGRGRTREPPRITTPSETTGSDESTVTADSASSTSTYTLPSHHGSSRNPAAKKAVKLVNKSIQAGDLELVRNATRRHTRDVGTTFPSPGESTTSQQSLSSSSSLERGGGRKKSPSKSHGLQKQRKSRKSPPKSFSQGVSWFISADNLRSEARKENQPEEEEEPRPSAAWFEPYSRIYPWREPLRQRQIHDERNQQRNFTHGAEPHSDQRTKITSSGLARISLQEALEMHRPDFISQSRQRMQRLAMQAEERRLQAEFSRERDLFGRAGGPGRLPRPAGTALLRRAVPWKEMIQRSKQIYENLPEVQRRREEERRKAEYRSYRLNAQLYNKRITSRVLGRRTAWH